MRPIDADMLYNEVSKMLHEGYNGQGILNEYSVSGAELSKVLKMIDEQPSIYNFNVLVDELTEVSQELKIPNGLAYHKTRMVRLDDAIEIVRRLGK